MFLATTEVRKASGDYVAPKLGRLTVGELGAEWLERKRSTIKQITYVNYEHIWRRQVLPAWGSVPVAAVDVLGVEAWVAELLRQGNGAGIVRRAASILGMVLGDAVKGKRISANPVKAIDNFPEEVPKRRVYLTDADVARLATEAGGNGTLVLTLAYCGLRWGEAAALRVRDIEFLRGRLSVTRNAVTVAEPAWFRAMRWACRRATRPRSVPVPRFVLDALSVLVRRQGSRRPRVPKPHRRFHGPTASVHGMVRGAVRRAGIQRDHAA